MQDKHPPKDDAKDKPTRTEQARQVAEEYANALRETIKKLRQRLHSDTMGGFREQCTPAKAHDARAERLRRTL
jgi:hypothetical protein